MQPPASEPPLCPTPGCNHKITPDSEGKAYCAHCGKFVRLSHANLEPTKAMEAEILTVLLSIRAMMKFFVVLTILGLVVGLFAALSHLTSPAAP